MYKRYAVLGTIWALLIVAGLITNSFFPSVVRENLGLYEPYEYSQMYLEDDTYTDLIIEYDYVEGFGPGERSMDLLEQRVSEYTEKDRIVSKIDQKIDPGNTSISYDERDIANLKEAYRSYERHGDTLTIHVLYLNGYWGENREALGLSQKPFQVVVFKGMIRSFSRTGGVAKYKVEQGVLVHEFGHLLSLVAIDYPSDHEDSVYPNHCSEEAGECVMAGSVERNKNGEVDPPPTDLCELCKDDLEKIKNLEGPLGFENLLNYGILSGYGLFGVGVTIVGLTWKKEEKREPSGYRYEERYQEEEYHEEKGTEYEVSNASDEEDIYY